MRLIYKNTGGGGGKTAGILSVFYHRNFDCHRILFPRAWNAGIIR